MRVVALRVLLPGACLLRVISMFVEPQRQNRRALVTSAGEKTASNECSHSERAGFLPVTGDPIACRSALNERNRHSGSTIAPLRLCAFAGWVAGWALRSSRFKDRRAGPKGPASRGLLEIRTGRGICVDLRFRFRQANSVFSVHLWFSDRWGKTQNSKLKTQNSNLS